MAMYVCQSEMPPAPGQPCMAYTLLPDSQVIPQLTVEQRDQLTGFFLEIMLVGFAVVMAKRQLLRR